MKSSIHVSTLLVAILAAGTQALAQVPGMSLPPKHYPWSNARLSSDVRAHMVIKEMTLDEKIHMVHGPGWQALFQKARRGPGARGGAAADLVGGIPRLGIPGLRMTDSVLGISHTGKSGRYATPLPSAEAMAAGWDRALSFETGTMVGKELRALGFNMTLGSGIDLVREPRSGRTFEYMGEDPLLAGVLAGEVLKAEKDLHIVTDIKHYAVNDQEAGRITLNSVIGKRAMRESDLLAFQTALKVSGAGAVMCAYNKVNGVYACQNKYLLTDVLKHDFGFKGFVLSDWGATHSTVKAAMAGLDMEMPGNHLFGEKLKKAVETGKVPMARLNNMVHRILRTEFDAGIVDYPPVLHSPDVMRGFKVAQKVEEEGIVLLKNAHDLLPLRASSLRSIGVIGGHADAGVMSGGGSAQVSPPGGNAVPPKTHNPMALLRAPVYQPSPPLSGIRAMARSAVVTFDPGTDPTKAAALAKRSQVAIVFAVQHESEGMDLPSLSLPNHQNALIDAVAAANPHTIVVLETGGPVLMPWIDKVGAVVEAWYPGIRGAQAIARILFGVVNPSGRLPLSFPKREADLPHPILENPPVADAQHPAPHLAGFPALLMRLEHVGPSFNVVYNEGLKVGYKWYDAEKMPVLFPFGFGLSYTSFGFSGLAVKPGNISKVSFTVENTGKRAGVEIAQVYASLPKAAGEPPKRLVGWVRVKLRAGEAKRVTVPVRRSRFAIYDEHFDAWKLVPGRYVIRVGSSSRQLPLHQTAFFEHAR